MISDETLVLQVKWNAFLVAPNIIVNTSFIHTMYGSYDNVPIPRQYVNAYNRIGREYYKFAVVRNACRYKIVGLKQGYLRNTFLISK